MDLGGGEEGIWGVVSEGDEERGPGDRVFGADDEGYSMGGLGCGGEGSLGDMKGGLEIGRGIWSRGRRFQRS